ncbi:MAG TPA: NADH-quinone oxidoreductase subunit C, partial [Thermoleophilia bacterium]
MPAGDTRRTQPGIVDELRARFPNLPLVEQRTADEIPTVWAPAARLKELLAYLKTEADRPFASLYDLGGIDERLRAHRAGQPDADFTVFYHLLSYERNA